MIIQSNIAQSSRPDRARSAHAIALALLGTSYIKEVRKIPAKFLHADGHGLQWTWWGF